MGEFHLFISLMAKCQSLGCGVEYCLWHLLCNDQVVYTMCASVTKQYKSVPVKRQWCCAAGKVNTVCSDGWPHHGCPSPFIALLCHSDWLLHEESCPRLDVVHPGRAWSSSLTCTWHCSLHYLFLLTTSLFPHGMLISLLRQCLTVPSSLWL